MIESLVAYYRDQGAPQDQQMLIALLRDVQQEAGGVLTDDMLASLAECLPVKKTLLEAIVRRIPSLRMADVPHLLEMCQTCPKGRELRAWVESRYQVKSGGACVQAGFSYRTVPCMKNCKNGPSIKWDGTLYSHATKELISQLIQTGGQPK